MKIVHTNRHFHGKTVKLPNVGRTEIPADGVLELDEETGNLLVEKGGGDWTTPEALAAKEKAASEGIEPVEDELIASLNGMKVEELFEVAKEAGIKGYHLFKNKPEVLRTFIKNKLKAQKQNS